MASSAGERLFQGLSGYLLGPELSGVRRGNVLMELKSGGWCLKIEELVSSPLGMLAGNHAAKLGTTRVPVSQ